MRLGMQMTLQPLGWVRLAKAIRCKPLLECRTEERCSTFNPECVRLGTFFPTALTH